MLAFSWTMLWGIQGTPIQFVVINTFPPGKCIQNQWPNDRQIKRFDYVNLYLLRHDLIMRVIIAAVPAVIQAKSSQRRTPSTQSVTGSLGTLLSFNVMMVRLSVTPSSWRTCLLVKLTRFRSKTSMDPEGRKAAIGSLDICCFTKYFHFRIEFLVETP